MALLGVFRPPHTPPRFSPSQLSPTAPRSGGPSALREITPQLSLAVNILVSVLGTGAGVTWLTSKVVPDDLAVRFIQKPPRPTTRSAPACVRLQA